MKKILFLLVFVVAAIGLKFGYCQDNLLAVDKIDNKAKAKAQEDKVVLKEQSPVQPEAALEEAKPADDTGEQDLENIKAYREYRHIQHMLKLQGVSHLRVAMSSVAVHATAVMELWHQVFLA